MTIILYSEIVERNGKTIRENNMEKGHNIPLKTLVETYEGLRLFVVLYGRDCDGTPLYWLSFDEDWAEDMYGEELKFHARAKITGGYHDDSLKVIRKAV